MMRSRLFRARRLVRARGIFVKLLAPPIVVTLIIAVAGSALILRDIRARASTALDRDLLRDLVESQSSIRDQAERLIEAARFAANIADMSHAVERGDATTCSDLLRSAVALHREAAFFGVANAKGIGIVQLRRDNSQILQSSGSDWSTVSAVTRASFDRTGRGHIGISAVNGRPHLIAATPILSLDGEHPVGVALAGVPVNAVLVSSYDQMRRASGSSSRAGSALFTVGGAVLEAIGGTDGYAPPSASPLRTPIRYRGRVCKNRICHETVSLNAPLTFGDDTVAVLSIRERTAPSLAGARRATRRFSVLIVLVLAGAVVVGSALARVVLRQVRVLVEANRAMAEGNLTTRAEIITHDEVGEVARGFNTMADNLFTIHEELEDRVKARTEELHSLYQDVRTAADERSRFFATLSHEFRAPLAAIAAYGDVLRSGRRIDRAGVGNTLSKSARDLLGLVDDILEFARGEAVGFEVNLERLEIGALTRDVAQSVRALAARHGLRLSVDVADNTPPVHGDAASIRRTLLNLVSNAVKYTPTGGVVRISVASEDDFVRVTVADSGPGIPPGMEATIFEPFARVEGLTPEGAQRSTGMGLATAKRLVEAQNGRIWCETMHSEDGGATFHVAFPVFDDTTVTTPNLGGSTRPAVKGYDDFVAV